MDLSGRLPRVAWCACLLALGLWGAASAATTAAAETRQYVGVKRCRICHNSEKGGAQFTRWSESKHSKAYETLAGDEAKKIAKAKGIVDPQKAAACLSCHETGYGEPADHFSAGYVATEGVGCESCHGAGSQYSKITTMMGIRKNTLKAEDYGLVMPTKSRCIQCHNKKSPTYKPFDFAADSAKIAHAIPAAP